MKRSRVIPLIFLLGVLLYGLSRPESRSAAPLPSPSTPKTTERVSSEPRKPPTDPSPESARLVPSRPSAAPAAGAPPNVTPPPGTVPFRVHKGLVVAYGDILLGKTPRPEYPNTGFVAAPELNLWPNALIPFVIHPDLPHPERILQAFKYLQENSPVRFTPYAGEPDALVFMPLEDACLSYLGKVGGNQPIYLDAKCGTQEILHEILHALGFIHEHSRVDRDRYVAVDWNNVQVDKVPQFWLTPATWNEALLQRPFDYQSIMLYPPEAFARDRERPVLYPRGSEPIAPTKTGLSAEDLERLRNLYGGR